MKKQFDALFDIIKEPLRSAGGVKTDNSIRFIYPPKRELDFRAYLFDSFAPLLEAKEIPFLLLDLSDFLFDMLDDSSVEMLQEDEFDDYKWMKQALSKRIEASLQKRFFEVAQLLPGCTIIVHGTIALYPLIRFGDVLRGARDLTCRIVIAHPGEDRGGKIYFLDQPDSGNYLTIKLS
ncbi:MAG: hypothetical protein ABSG91_17570 [Syntrophobacteraceae bacterium]